MSPALHLLSIEPLTLAELARRDRPVSAERVVELGLWFCDALAQATQAPHDLALKNVWVVEHNGTVQGVVLPASLEGTRRTLTDDVASAMSPERCCGLACDVRADLYSVGCILFELASGRPLFEGEMQDVVAKQIMVRPPRLRCNMPALAAIIERLLEKEPADRYQSVDELRQALDAVFETSDAPARSAA